MEKFIASFYFDGQLICEVEVRATVRQNAQTGATDVTHYEARSPEFRRLVRLGNRLEMRDSAGIHSRTVQLTSFWPNDGVMFSPNPS